MVSPVLTVDADVAVDEAACTMGLRRIGSLVVTSDSKPVGIFTERDLITKVIARRRDMKKTRVRAVMSSPLVTADQEMSVRDAVILMGRKKIMRLPVVKGEELVGIVTGREIFSFLSFFIQSLV